MVNSGESCFIIVINLVGGLPTPLKNMSSSVVIIIIINIWKVIKDVPNHQPENQDWHYLVRQIPVMGKRDMIFGTCESCERVLLSGKLSQNYGKSPFLMGKSTINGHFQ